MIYRDEKRAVKGVWNREADWTAQRHIRIFADNLADVEQWLKDTPAKWAGTASRTTGSSESWDLNTGYNAAMKLAKEGWGEGAKDLDARLQTIIPAAGREGKWGYAVSGSSVNVGRFVTGHPKDMRNSRKRVSGSAPVYHLVVNLSATCNVGAQQMANYGTALVGLIDRLENTGKRVRLDVVSVGHLRGNARLAFGWNVKHASEHIDLAAVAFSIGHPAAFRRIGFAMMERSPKNIESSGYGHSADLLPADLIDEQDYNGAMLIDGVNHGYRRCNSTEDALRYAVEQLNKAAVLAGHSTIDDPLIDDLELFGN